MKYLNGLLIIAVFAFITACGGGDKDAATEGETASTEKKEGEATKPEAKKESAAEVNKKILTSKTWKADMDAAFKAMMEADPKIKEQYDKMSDEEKKLKEEAFKKTSQMMTFNEDGSFINTMKVMGNEMKTEGTWSLSEDGTVITVKQGEKVKEDGDKEGDKVAEKKEGEKVAEKKEGEKTAEKKEGEKTAEKKEGKSTSMTLKEVTENKIVVEASDNGRTMTITYIPAE